MSAAVVAIALGLYFLPSIVAAIRGVDHAGSIIVIDIFLGWTLVGWVVALAMACRTTHRPPTLIPTVAADPNDSDAVFRAAVNAAVAEAAQRQLAP